MELEASVYKTSDIFDLGYQFGVKEQELRHQGKNRLVKLLLISK